MRFPIAAFILAWAALVLAPAIPATAAGNGVSKTYATEFSAATKPAKKKAAKKKKAPKVEYMRAVPAR